MKSYWIACSIAMVVAGVQEVQKPSPPDAPSVQTNAPASTDSRKTHKRVHADLSGFDLAPKSAATDSGVQIGGGTRGGLPSPLLFAPQRSKCYATAPTFYWGKAGALNKFRLTVYASNDDVVYDAAVEGKSFTYPASAPPLEPGKTYSWTVQPVGTLMAEPAQPVELVLLSREEREAIQQKVKAVAGESLEERIRRAEIFVNGRLWYDAIEAYTTLIIQYPDEADLYNARGEIYDQIPATRELAEKDFLRADNGQAREKRNSNE
jgi:hypothetical protein